MPRPATKKQIEKLERDLRSTSTEAVQVFYVRGGSPDYYVEAFPRAQGHVIPDLNS